MARWYVFWHIEVRHYVRICIHIHTWSILDMDLLSHCPNIFSFLFIIIHLSFFILWIMFVSCRWYFGTFWLVPWPTLARVLRYRHAKCYGSTCWLVARVIFNQSYFHLETISSVYGIRWRFCLTVLLFATASSWYLAKWWHAPLYNARDWLHCIAFHGRAGQPEASMPQCHRTLGSAQVWDLHDFALVGP
jgi:hypothetical protein